MMFNCYNKRKYSVRLLAIILATIFFLSDIAWAYPVTFDSSDKLAVQSMFQKEAMGFEAKELGFESDLKGKVVCALASIAGFLLFRDPVKSEKLNTHLRSLRIEMGAICDPVSDCIVWNEIAIDSGIVRIPFLHKDSKYYIYVAKKDNRAFDQLPGTREDIIGSYSLKAFIRAKSSQSDDISMSLSARKDAFGASDIESVREAIAVHYDIGSIKDVNPIQSRFGRWGYCIKSDKGTYFFSTIWAGYSDRQLEVMKTVTDHVSKGSFGKKYFVPKIISTRGGMNFINLPNGYYYLRLYDGDSYAIDTRPDSGFYCSLSMASLKSAARALAEYHNSVSDLIIPENADQLTLKALTKRLDILKVKLDTLKRGELSADMQLLIDAVIKSDVVHQIDDLGKSFGSTYARLPKRVIHGDFQAMNILFKEEEVFGVIDYEHTKYDARLVDFIAGILEMRENDATVDRSRIEGFLSEYMKYGDLTIEELEALPIMLKLNYLNRIAGALTDFYGTLESDMGYRRYISDCLKHVEAIDSFSWDSLIMPLKIRQITWKSLWADQIVLISKEFENSSVDGALKFLFAILRSSTYLAGNIKALTPAEKVRLFGKAYSLAITSMLGDDKEILLQKVEKELLENPGQFEPEAIFLGKSFLAIARADVPSGTKVSTVIACHGEQDAIIKREGDTLARAEHFLGDDNFLRTRIEQLKELYAVNQNFSWDLVVVGDGDDRTTYSGLTASKTIDIAKAILKTEYQDLYRDGKVRVIELPEDDKTRINSQKGGAITLGMRDALEHGADYVFFLNAVPAYHAGQEGLLLKELLYGADMAIASRKLRGSISKRSWLRELKSLVYNSYISAILPWVKGIPDTQAGFKGFSRECLESILPVNGQGEFDLLFDYGLSFDTNLISRAKILNKGIIQVPVTRINFPHRISRADSPLKIITMIAGILRQRLLFVPAFRRYVEAQRKVHPEEFLVKESTGKTYSYRISADRRTVMVESLALHEGERSIMIIQKDGGARNNIKQYVPMNLGTAVHGLVGFSALKQDSSSISTMEHLASAIRATGVRGLDIRLYGPACPMLDGNSMSWVRIFDEAGWVDARNLNRPSFVVNKPIVLLRDTSISGRFILILSKFRKSLSVAGLVKDLIKLTFPTEGYDVSTLKGLVLPLENGGSSRYTSVLTLPYIPTESLAADFEYGSYEAYLREVAGARTFVPLKLWTKQGEGSFGGALPGKNIHTLWTHRRDRANEWSATLKWANEPSRHKIADMIGDIYLAEAELGGDLDIRGWYVGVGNGHRDNIELGMVLKKYVTLSRDGIEEPLMALINADGSLRYVKFNGRVVSRELDRISKAGFFKGQEGLYNELLSRVNKTSAIPESTSMAASAKIFLALAVSAGITLVISTVSHAVWVWFLSVAIFVVFAPSFVYYGSASFLFLVSKICRIVSGVLGSGSVINYERKERLERELRLLGAEKILFANVENKLLQLNTDGSFILNESVLDDTLVFSVASKRRIVTSQIFKLNQYLQERLVRFILMEYKRLLDLKGTRGLARLYKVVFLPTLIYRYFHFRNEAPDMGLDKAPLSKVIQNEVVDSFKSFFEKYDQSTWRTRLKLLKNELGDVRFCEFIQVLITKNMIDPVLKNKNISDFEYEMIVAKACSLALGRTDGATVVVKKLRDLLEKICIVTKGTRSDAIRTINSYIETFDIKKPIFAVTLFAMYGEQERIQKQGTNAEDFLRIKIEQIEDLANVNPDNFRWEIDIVNDGDDSNRDKKDRDGAQRRSLDIAMDIIKKEYPQFLNDNNTGKVRFFMLPQSIKEAIKSKKGGAIMYGLWTRLKDKTQKSDRPDIFILTDADITVPLGFEGLFLGSVFKGNVGMVIGSAQLEPGDVKREHMISQWIYRAYIKMVQRRMPELKNIQDTMMGFKAARSDVLELILPFSSEGGCETPALDATFVSRMSFDEDMLGRIASSGYTIEEMPVNWIKSEAASFRGIDRLEAVYETLVNVPKDIIAWKKRLLKDAAAFLVRNNEYQRRYLISDMVGSSVSDARASVFIKTILSGEVYRLKGIKEFIEKDRRDASGHITRQERTEFLSRAVSAYLRKKDGTKGFDEERFRYLESLLRDKSNGLLPEAKLLLKSYQAVCKMHALPSGDPITVSVVSHLFRTRKKILCDHMEQVENVMWLNPSILWRSYWVLQSDASSATGFSGSLKEAKDAINELSEDVSKTIKIISTTHEEISRIESVKGGSVIVGLAEALKDGSDYLMYCDMSLVPNFAQAGMILNELARGGRDMVIASRRRSDSIGRRVWFRRLFSYLLNKWIWLYHKDLQGMNDSQAGLKGLTNEQAKIILPVAIDADGKRSYDLTFDYGLSFEVALMARAVRNGYGVREVPIIDTFEMSSKPDDHPLPRLYGKKVKDAVRTQAEAVKDFDGVWRFIGQGGEYQTFSHPSLSVVMQIPRPTNGFIRKYLTSEADEDGQKPFRMMIAALCLKTPPTKAFFFWFLHHAMRKNYSEEKKNLLIARSRLGGLVVPFSIIENHRLRVFYSAWHSVWVMTKNAFMVAIYPIRIMGRALIVRPVKFAVNLILAAPVSLPQFMYIPASVIARASVAAMYYSMCNTYKFIKFQVNWILNRSIIKEFLKLNKPGVILTLPFKILRGLSRTKKHITNKTGEAVQIIFDHVPLISNVIRTFDILTRPLWKVALRVFNRLKNILNSLFIPIEVEPEYVLFKEKVASFGDILLRLDRDKTNRAASLEEAKGLIERFIRFQKDLWRRGAFDHESHLLGDIGVDKNGNLLIVDLGVIIFDLDEACKILRPENMGRDYMTQEVLRSALSSELYDYYISRIKEEVTEANIRSLWLSGSGEIAEVAIPAGIPKNSAIINDYLRNIDNYYQRLILLAQARQEYRSPEYLDNDKDIVPTKVILRALRKGGWEERVAAEKLIRAIAGLVSNETDAVGMMRRTSKLEWNVLFDQLICARPDLRRPIVKYFNLDIIAGTSIEWILSDEIIMRLLACGVIDNTTAHLYRSKYMSSSLRGMICDRGEEYHKNIPILEIIKGAAFSQVDDPDSVVINTGQGQRQGVLSRQAGTKGDVLFLGRRLADWAGRSCSKFSSVVPAEYRPVLFSPTDVILLTPEETEAEHIKSTLVSSDRSIVFFSPADKRLKPDLSRPFSETLAELLLSALLNINPNLGRFIIRKFVVPYAQNAERKTLIKNNGGYDFPGTWAVSKDKIGQAKKVFLDWAGKRKVNWWHALRLPLRVGPKMYVAAISAIKENLDFGSENSLSLMAHRDDVRDFVVKSGGAHARTLVHPWIDCNTPYDLVTIYRALVDEKDFKWRARIRRTFEFPPEGDVIDSVVRGAIVCDGSYMINNSSLDISDGVILKVGEGVVIDNSHIVITGKPGDIVTIPSGTIVAYSTIHGDIQSISGNGRENFLHGVYSETGFRFEYDGKLSGTLVTKDGQVKIYSQDYEFVHAKEAKVGAGDSIPPKDDIDLEATRDIMFNIKPKIPKALVSKNGARIVQEAHPVRTESFAVYSVDHMPSESVTVTGGAGFIASHLCDSLTASGERVVATVRKGRTSPGNIAQSDNLYPIGLDLDSPDFTELSMLVQRSKIVYHLAALGNQALTMEYPVETYITNSLTTGILASLCESAGKRFILTSTYVVYDLSGKAEGEKVSESEELPNLKAYPEHAAWLNLAEMAFSKYIEGFIELRGKVNESPSEFVHKYLLTHALPPVDKRMLGQNYPLSKLLAERLVLRMKNSIVLRLGNVYGTGQPEETMIPFFMRSLINAKDGGIFTVWPSNRDLLHVNDIVKIMRFFEDNIVPQDQRIINITAGENLSASDIANTIKEALGIEKKCDHTGDGVVIKVDESKKDEIMPSLVVDNGRMKRLVGVTHLVSFKEGVRNLVPYYTKKYSGGCSLDEIYRTLITMDKGDGVTLYQILGRKRYPKAVILDALNILQKQGRIRVGDDGGYNTYAAVASAASSEPALFDIAKDYINNNRDSIVRDVNKIRRSIYGDVSGEVRYKSSDITVKLETDIRDLLNDLASTDLDCEIEDLVKRLPKKLNMLMPESVVESIIVLARKAGRDNQKLIFGFEADWIPGYGVMGSLQHQAMNPLVLKIEAIAEILGTYGLNNIEIVHESSANLANAIIKRAEDTGTSLSNLVILASKSTVEMDNFTLLRMSDAKDRPFISVIDPSKLNAWCGSDEAKMRGLNVDLLSLISLTLELAIGQEPPKLPIILSYDAKRRIAVFLPEPVPLSYEMLKDLYIGQALALQAA